MKISTAEIIDANHESIARLSLAWQQHGFGGLYCAVGTLLTELGLLAGGKLTILGETLVLEAQLAAPVTLSETLGTKEGAS